MRKLNRTLIVVLIVAVASCTKNAVDKQAVDRPLSIDPAKVYKTPSTPQEKLLVENIAKVTEIFKELYKDRSNLKLVNAAIYSRAFTDESVLLKDLIYPETSWLNKVDKFKSLSLRWNVSLTRFSQNFWSEAAKRKDPQLDAFLTSLNAAARMQEDNNGNNQNVTIYFPYSDEFIPPAGGSYEPITSVVTATADADEGFGNLPYYQDGVLQYYFQVLVNDDFCFNHPTHIIGVNGIEEVLEPQTPNDAPPPPPPPPGISRIYIGEGVCKEQFDRLISFTGNGGGSEIKYCHLTGYLQPVNGHVTTFQDITSVDFSRKDIRQKKWKRIFGVWDDDWSQADLEQVLAIYEEDNTNTRTFNGSLGTTLKVDSNTTITASIGFTVSVQSQDEIIKQLKISRNSYFTGSFQNQGHDFSNDATFLPPPFTHGWPAYDVHYWTKEGADVGWTWPYNTY